METLAEFIPRFERLGSREVLRYYNGYRTWRLSYGEMHARIRAFAEELRNRGLEKGDRLLIWGENHPAWVIGFWSAVSLGVPVIPVDARFSPSLLGRIEKEAEPRLAVVGDSAKAAHLNTASLTYDDIMSLEESERPIPSAEGGPSTNDIVEIVYTSGTTATPKGVVHRHRNICANLRPFEEEIDRYRLWARPFQPVRFLNLLPLSHMFGQSAGMLVPFLLGGGLVLTSELNPGSVIETIRREKVSVLVTVPRLLEQLEQEVRRRHTIDDVKRGTGLPGVARRWWRYRGVHREFGWKFWALLVGGARVDRNREEFWSRLGWLVVQGYGLTEASPIVAVNHPFRTRAGTLGRPVKGQEVRLAPDGEILVRGESVVTEYLGQTEHGGAPEDGWLHTGDLGEIDDEGNIYYRGRKRDLIVTSEGMNVFPEDIEAVLDQDPEVKESVVVGAPEDGGEVIHAVLLPADHSIDEEAVIRRANTRLELHQRIRVWSIWPGEDFPRTASTGKVQRGEVARLIRSGGPGTPAEEATTEKVSELDRQLARMSGLSPAHLDDHLRLTEDLGLTSLDRIDLLAWVEEHYGLSLAEEEHAGLATVGELRSLTGVSSQLGPSRPTESRPETAGDRAGEQVRERETAMAASMPRWTRWGPVRWFRAATRELLIVPLFRHYVPVTVIGHENLKGVEGPLIFIANHNSHLDTVAILAALPRECRRRVAPAMSQDHFPALFRKTGFSLKERFLDRLSYDLACGLFNAFPIPQRMGGVRRSLRYAGELVGAGYSLLVFPEGLRSPDGTLQKFRPGAALMAERLKIPVLPVHLQGMFEVYSVHDSWARTGRVRVTFGGLMRLEEGEDYVGFAERMEARIRELSQG